MYSAAQNAGTGHLPASIPMAANQPIFEVLAWLSLIKSSAE
jgi:hypothetical protein